MIIMNRLMSADKQLTAKDLNSTYLPQSQASFNSDGSITLRNYDKANKNKDQIIVFNESETRALLTLFDKISIKKINQLPF